MVRCIRGWRICWATGSAFLKDPNLMCIDFSKQLRLFIEVDEVVSEGSMFSFFFCFFFFFKSNLKGKLSFAQKKKNLFKGWGYYYINFVVEIEKSCNTKVYGQFLRDYQQIQNNFQHKFYCTTGTTAVQEVLNTSFELLNYISIYTFFQINVHNSLCMNK